MHAKSQAKKTIQNLNSSLGIRLPHDDSLCNDFSAFIIQKNLQAKSSAFRKVAQSCSRPYLIINSGVFS